MEKVNAKLSIGKTFFKHIPQLELIVTDEQGTDTFYLSPFRAYGFQVSETDDGIGSAGQSEFLGLENIVRANSKTMAIRIFRALALNAIMDHNRYYENSYYPSFNEFKVFDQFIDASYDWVKSIVDEENKRITQEEFSKIELQHVKEESGFIDNIKTKVLDIKSKVWKKQA